MFNIDDIDNILDFTIPDQLIEHGHVNVCGKTVDDAIDEICNLSKRDQELILRTIIETFIAQSPQVGSILNEVKQDILEYLMLYIPSNDSVKLSTLLHSNTRAMLLQQPYSTRIELENSEKIPDCVRDTRIPVVLQHLEKQAKQTNAQITTVHEMAKQCLATMEQFSNIELFSTKSNDHKQAAIEVLREVFGIETNESAVESNIISYHGLVHSILKRTYRHGVGTMLETMTTEEKEEFLHELQLVSTGLFNYASGNDEIVREAGNFYVTHMSQFIDYKNE